MKKMMIILAFAIFWQTNVDAQCGVNTYKHVMKIEEPGLYLSDKVFESNKKRKRKISFVLNTGSTYGFYVLNPSKELPTLIITDSKGNQLKTKEIYNEDKNYRGYFYKVPKAGIFKVEADFNGETDACALFVLFFIDRDKEHK